MKIDIRNLDLVKDLLQVVNDEIKNNPIYYSDLNGKLIKILNKYEDLKLKDLLWIIKFLNIIR